MVVLEQWQRVVSPGHLNPMLGLGFLRARGRIDTGSDDRRVRRTRSNRPSAGRAATGAG